MTSPANPTARRHAFSLVEVTLALGIMAVCIIPAFGLLPVGINANQASLNQTRAASIITNICSDVRGTPLSNTTTPRFKIALGQTTAQTFYLSTSGDTFSTASSAAGQYQYRAVVTMIPAPAPAATALNVVVSWPAAANNPTSKYQSTTAINR